MAKIEVRCGACGHEARVPEQYRGKKVRCLRCRAEMRAEPTGAPSSRRSSERAPRPDREGAPRGHAPPMRGAPSSRARREVQEAIREILADYEHAIEPCDRGFDVDLRGVALGLARTLVEDVIATPGVRDVKLAGGAGECRLLVTLEGVAFDPEDSFADESDETEVFHKPSPRGRSPLDLADSVEKHRDERDAPRGEPRARRPEPEPDGRDEETGTEALGEKDREAEGARAIAVARSKEAEGDARGAVRVLEDAFRRDAKHAPVLEALGHAYAATGDVERARRAFRELERLRPDDPDAHVLHAAAAFACDRLDDARSSLVEAIRLDPRHAKAYRYAAKLYERQGDLASAKKFRAKYEELKNA